MFINEIENLFEILLDDFDFGFFYSSYYILPEN